MKKILIPLLLCTSQVHAKSVYYGMLQNAYQTQAPHRCNNCHSTTSLALNAFGKDFSALKRGHGPNQLADVWRSLGEMDSDQDGVLNQEELAQGLNPGVPGK